MKENRKYVSKNRNKSVPLQPVAKTDIKLQTTDI
jgi:hypothetical protein